MAAEKRYTYTLQLCGEEGAGKTHLITRLVLDCFVYIPCVPDPSKTLNDGTTIKVNDQENILLRNTGRSTYIDAYVLTYDITNSKSFEYVKNTCNRYSVDRPIIIVGTKSDLEEQRQVKKEEVTSFVSSQNSSNIFFFGETSAKTGENVKELFEFSNDIIKQKEEEKRQEKVRKLEEERVKKEEERAKEEEEFYRFLNESKERTIEPSSTIYKGDGVTIGSSEKDSLKTNKKHEQEGEGCHKFYIDTFQGKKFPDKETFFYSTKTDCCHLVLVRERNDDQYYLLHFNPTNVTKDSSMIRSLGSFYKTIPQIVDSTLELNDNNRDQKRYDIIIVTGERSTYKQAIYHQKSFKELKEAFGENNINSIKEVQTGYQVFELGFRPTDGNIVIKQFIQGFGYDLYPQQKTYENVFGLEKEKEKEHKDHANNHGPKGRSKECSQSEERRLDEGSSSGRRASSSSFSRLRKGFISHIRDSKNEGKGREKQI